MISVATYPLGEAVATTTFLSSRAGQVFLGGIVLALFGYYEFDFRSSLRQSINNIEITGKNNHDDILKIQGDLKTLTENRALDAKRIDDSAKTIGDLRDSVTELKANYKNLERVLYKTKAEAAGFKNPDIVTTALGANQKFETRTPTQHGEFLIIYTIMAYNLNQKELRIRFDGYIGGMIFRDNTFIIHNVQPGAFTRLPTLVPGPPIFV